MDRPPITEKQPSWAHIGFMAVLGLLGWTLMVSPDWVPGFVPSLIPPLTGGTAIVFIAVVVIARSLAFSPLPGTVISMDSGFYVAATLCVGSIAAGRLAAVALTVDALVRLLTGPRQRTRRQWIDAAVYVGYFGGLSGALLAVVARVFDADSAAVLMRADDWLVFTRVVAIGCVFITLHYAIQAVRSRLAGHRTSSYVTRLGMPAVLAELTLLPLAAVAVYVFDPRELLGLVLLAVTYVLIIFGFNRLSRVGAKLRKRVVHLETLGRTSTRLAACLQIHELIEAVAEATTTAIASAEALSFCELGSDGQLSVDSFFPGTGEFRRSRLPAAEGAAAQVVAEERVIVRSGKGLERGTALDHAASWVGVPVGAFGEVSAVLVIESSKAGAFDADERLLLEGIASQTAVALQNVHHYELAMVDGLTRLFVRRYFDARLDEEVERARRYETEFSVVMIDIDDFKQLNDRYGHAVGDAALKQAARAVREEMRGIDTAARYGGEEFALILPRTGLTESLALAERIRRHIAELSIPSDEGVEPVKITASFGIAAFVEGGAHDGAGVLMQADRALYRAKRSGKNRVELYWGDGSKDRRTARMSSA